METMSGLRYRIDPDTGCWVWTGALTTGGYSSVSVGGKVQYGHRVSYQLHRGGIPKHLQVDHLCRNRACINPDHLELVTHAENGRRGSRAKLTHEAVALIRAAPSSVTHAELARQLGVDECTVSAARNHAAEGDERTTQDSPEEVAVGAASTDALRCLDDGSGGGRQRRIPSSTSGEKSIPTEPHDDGARGDERIRQNTKRPEGRLCRKPRTEADLSGSRLGGVALCKKFATSLRDRDPLIVHRGDLAQLLSHVNRVSALASNLVPTLLERPVREVAGDLVSSVRVRPNHELQRVRREIAVSVLDLLLALHVRSSCVAVTLTSRNLLPSAAHVKGVL